MGFEDLNPDKKSGSGFSGLSGNEPKEESKPKRRKAFGYHKDLWKGIANIPKDIVQTGSDITQAVIHPIETAGKMIHSVADPLAGAIEAGARKIGIKPAPEFQNKLSPEEEKFHSLMSKVTEAIKKPDEAIDKVVDMARERPVATGLSVSMGTGMASKGAKALGAESAAEKLSKVSKLINPITAAKIPVQGAINALAETKFPERLIRGATKFPKTNKWTKSVKEESKITKATEQQLEHKIKPTEAGAVKTQKLMNEDMKVVNDVITKGSKKGDFITNDNIRKGLRAAYVKAAKSSDPVGAKLIVDEIAEKFKAHGDKISTSKAQGIKQQLYDEVTWGSSEATALKTQLNALGKKGMANVIMKHLEKQYPEIVKYNKRYGALKDLKYAIDRATARLDSNNIVDLPSKILFLKDPLVSIFHWTLGHPQVKTTLAFYLDKIRKQKFVGPTTP